MITPYSSLLFSSVILFSLAAFSQENLPTHPAKSSAAEHAEDIKGTLAPPTQEQADSVKNVQPKASKKKKKKTKKTK